MAWLALDWAKSDAYHPWEAECVPRRSHYPQIILLLLPFLVAALLNVLPHSDGIEHLSMFFYAPWAWLLDSAMNPYLIPKIRPLFLYIFFLWIPALLYSVCIGIMLLAANYTKNRATKG
jgi:hypothetical protein